MVVGKNKTKTLFTPNQPRQYCTKITIYVRARIVPREGCGEKTIGKFAMENPDRAVKEQKQIANIKIRLTFFFH